MHLRLVATQASDRTWQTSAPEPGFNSRDLIALTCWMQQADVHGYRRVLIEGGADEAAEGGYVLIYAPGRDWASWGLAREGAEVMVWHCGTGADLGRFTTMFEALQRLPPVWSGMQVQAGSLMRGRAVSQLTQPPGAMPRLSVVHRA